MSGEAFRAGASASSPDAAAPIAALTGTADLDLAAHEPSQFLIGLAGPTGKVVSFGHVSFA
jgi:hypothetical protein